MSKNITVTVQDTHSLGLFDVATGQYLGIIYVTSGSIVGSPIISQSAVTVTSQENGIMYMSTYELPTKKFIRKIRV
jgi:heme oxygenase